MLAFLIQGQGVYANPTSEGRAALQEASTATRPTGAKLPSEKIRRMPGQLCRRRAFSAHKSVSKERRFAGISGGFYFIEARQR
jgi:hypothetical protein